MVKLILLLVILGALAAFALQNLASVSLVIFGIKTLALPLAVWVIGAIGAGAFTTLVMAGLLQFGRPVRENRQPGRTARQTRSGFGETFRNVGWTRGSSSTETNASATNRSGASATGYTSRPNRNLDDWEADGREEWDDWDDIPEPIDRPGARSTETRERQDEDWEGRERSERRRTAEPSDRPRQTDFEAPQAPTARSQSGSVYSYRYGGSEDEAEDGGRDVYDAEYRVITPPYRPTPVDPTPEPHPSNDDWDFDDDWETDRSRNP